MALQRRPKHQRLEQLGWRLGAGAGIHAMKCASVSSSIYSRVHCAVAAYGGGKEKSLASSQSSRQRPNPLVSSAVVDVVADPRGAGPAGLSGLSAARQRVPWPLL